MTTDFKLRHLQQSSVSGEELAHVLVQFKNNISVLQELGCNVTTVFGDVAAVNVQIKDLARLQEHPEIVFVEASRVMKDETDVSTVTINLTDGATGSRTIPGNGRGAVIGIIDSGFDLTHPCFLDAHRASTRIIAAWDQVNLEHLPGNKPTGFDYGVEYSRDIINRYIEAGKILVVKSQNGAGAHGTYVAGIAAGNGTPQGIYKGVAPEADLILVTYRRDVPVGGSAFVLDAINYIQMHAGGRPVVINISQGDNLGAHDGTNLLERAIDNVIGQGRILIVSSAGNERGGNHHAQGEVEERRDFTLPFTLLQAENQPVDNDTIEIWYRHGDRFAVALQPPGDSPSEFVAPGAAKVVKFPAGNQAYIYSQLEHPTNGDNHIGIILEKSDGWTAGTWQLLLRGEKIMRGDFDAWADRPNAATCVSFEKYQSDASTITLPGNARRIITVGGFVSRPPGDTDQVIKGSIADGSSIGPTRDGRVKPDLAAPSSLIMSPRRRVDDCPTAYDAMEGTSMAAPHVTGIIALLWSLWPELMAEQISSAIKANAHQDMFTGATPNTSCGYGKLDAHAVYNALLTRPRKALPLQPRKETNTMKMKMDLVRQPNDEVVPVTVHLDLKGEEIVGIRGVNENDGEEYHVSLLISHKTDGGDECWICDNPPCPPNQKTYYAICPIGGSKPK